MLCVWCVYVCMVCVCGVCVVYSKPMHERVTGSQHWCASKQQHRLNTPLLNVSDGAEERKKERETERGMDR